MSSRFFHGDSESSSSEESEEELYGSEHEDRDESDSESDSENDSDSDSDSSSDDGKTGAARFLKDEASDSDSEEDEKVTVVKSAKDKRLDELEGIIRLIENAQKVKDWSTVATRKP